MRVVKTCLELTELRSSLEQSVGFVPTMGALHEGHESLIQRSKQENQQTWVSVFVNPTQFNQKEDLEKYPRPLQKDLSVCERLGVNLVFIPEVQEMYPEGDFYRICETRISEKWCGQFRPGHFSGMLTVVLKLLQLTRADRAYFGEKDYQQLLLVKGLVKEFFLPTQIVPCPTLREADGLAMSSRNIRLSYDERKIAQKLFQIISSNQSDEQCRLSLADAGFRVEYVETFQGRRLAAAWLGAVRLIDNVELDSSVNQGAACER